eukprot:CAMPEP_0175417092 /NCGR_PEP_ID=MMETSP0095-20121207/45023_1 /TAXON_ID=311494 /ORGANISM="Alexandrium monilatum, Strain CCMP3105" /LENGTH=117 /DNA_ID=CAMNT_0016716217 /DNA_START=151 /DNA_END=500 /DNA_ORIENTATION=+
MSTIIKAILAALWGQLPRDPVLCELRPQLPDTRRPPAPLRSSGDCLTGTAAAEATGEGAGTFARALVVAADRIHRGAGLSGGSPRAQAAAAAGGAGAAAGPRVAGEAPRPAGGPGRR